MTHKPALTELQNRIIGLNYEQFVELTNISDLVEIEYKKSKNDENARISQKHLRESMKFYFERTRNTKSNWDNCCLKNLKWRKNNDDDDDELVAATTSASRDDMDKEENPKPINAAKRKQTSSISTVHSAEISPAKKVKLQQLISEPSDFQKEIMQLNFDEFVEQTNIKQIIEREHAFFHLDEPIAEEKMAANLHHYFEKRVIVDKWQKCGLKNLKFNVCECKRNRKMKHKKLQCAVVKFTHRGMQSIAIDYVDAAVQCDLDFAVPENREEQIEEVRMSELVEYSQFNATMTSIPIDPLNQTHASTSLLPNNQQPISTNEAPQSTIATTADDSNATQINTSNKTEIDAEKEPTVDELHETEQITDAGYDQIDVENVRLHNESTQLTEATRVNVESSENHAIQQKSSEVTFLDDGIGLNIKTEKQDFSQYSDEVEIIDIPKDSTIVIEEDLDTEAMFAEMAKPIDGRRKGNQTLDESRRMSQSSSERSPLAEKSATQKSSETSNSEPLSLQSVSQEHSLSQQITQDMFSSTQEPHDGNETNKENTCDNNNILVEGTEIPIDEVLCPETNVTSAVCKTNTQIQVIHDINKFRGLRQSLKRQNEIQMVPQNVKKKAKKDALDKTIVPRFQYLSLDFVSATINRPASSAKKPKVAVEVNNNHEEPFIECDEETPPSSEINQREFMIEDDSSCEDNSESSLAVKTRSTLKLLNSQDSIFLNSQLGRACDKSYHTFVSAASVVGLTSTPEETSSTPAVASQQLNKGNEIANLPIAATRTLSPPKKQENLDIQRLKQTQVLKVLVPSIEKPIREPTESARNENEKHETIWINPIIFSNSFQYSFLTYIDVKEISPKFDFTCHAAEASSAIFPYEICHELKDIKVVLEFTCNGYHQIELHGRSVQKVLQLKIKEWSAVESILRAIREFTFHPRQQYRQPMRRPQPNIFHDVLFYLFKTVSRFSHVLIEYREDCSNMVGVIDSVYELNRNTKRKNLSQAIDAYTKIRIMSYYERKNKSK